MPKILQAVVLVLLAACDGETPPVAAASPVATAPRGVATAPRGVTASPIATPAAPAPPAVARATRWDGDELPVGQDLPLFARADGSGAPVTVREAGDVARIAAALPGATVVEHFRDIAIVLDGHAAVRVATGSQRVSITLAHAAVATTEGVHPGMSFAALRRAAPGMSCQVEGGEDGTFVHCDLPRGWTASFRADRAPSAATPGLDEIGAALGHAAIASLSWSATGVPIATPPSAETGVLPAGVHWLPWRYSPCDATPAPARCVVPRAAVIAQVHDTAAATQAALATLDATALAPGYPLIAHTDELGLAVAAERPGVAIVLGLFASVEAARAWQTSNAPTASVTVLAERDALSLQRQPERVVVRLRDLAKPRVFGACTIQPGTIAIVPQSVVSEHVYEHIVFPCDGGGEAALPWRDTLYGAVLGEDARGLALWQTVGAECEVPRFERWDTDASGRTRGRGRMLAARGCG